MSENKRPPEWKGARSARGGPRPRRAWVSIWPLLLHRADTIRLSFNPFSIWPLALTHWFGPSNQVLESTFVRSGYQSHHLPFDQRVQNENITSAHPSH